MTPAVDVSLTGAVTGLPGPVDAAIYRIAQEALTNACLLYTSDAADERSSVDLGGRRIIKKKNKHTRMRPR